MFEAAAMSPEPYPGLRPFKREEFDIFFGRDRHVDAMIEKLEAARFLCVTGPSGCGKSSLARTGLFNALEAGFLEGYGSDWVFCDFRPGDVPLNRLSTALAHAILSGDSSNDIDAELKDDKEELASFFRNQIASSSSDLNLATRKAVALRKRPIVILVDQFEEIFRYAQADPHEAARFVDVLLKTAQARKDIFVVITIRTDELAKCARYEGLTSAINDSQFLTPTLDRFQMQEAIEGPVTLFGGQVDTRLTVWLLNALEEQLDKLPLMQHALKLLYAHKRHLMGEDGFVIDKNDFIEVFGLSPEKGLSERDGRSILNLSLSNRLDGMFKDLHHDLRPVARRVFTALTNVDSQGRDIRNPMRLDELAATSGASVDKTRKVIRAFAAGSEAYLQPPGDAPLNGDTVIDVTHECVLRLWERLRGKWIAGEQSNAENIRLLARMARDRDTAARLSLWERISGASLLKGHVLDRYARWWSLFNPNLTWATRYLNRVHWGTTTGQTEPISAAKKFDHVRDFVEASQRYSRNLRASSAVAAVLAIAIVGYSLNERASWRKEQAQTELRLAIANSIDPTPDALFPIDNIAPALEVANLAQGLENGATEQANVHRKLWHALAYAHEVRRFQTGTESNDKVQSAKFAFDGRQIVTLSADATVSLWATEDRSKPLKAFRLIDHLTYNGEGERIARSLEVAPDGRTAAVGMRRGGILLVDLETAEITELHPGPPDPDGEGPKKAPSASVLDVAFSPDGTHLAASSLDTVARVWARPKSANPATPLQGWSLDHEVKFDRGVWSVDISGDNIMLAAGLSNGDVCARNLFVGGTSCSAEGHTEVVKAVAFRPGTRVLVSAGNDDRAVLWKPVYTDTSYRVRLTPSGAVLWHDSDIWDVDFNPTGDLLSTTSWDGAIRVFEAGSWRPTITLRGHEAPPRTVSFDQTGNFVVSGATDRTARIWTPFASLAEDARFSYRLAARDDRTHSNVDTVAFAPDASLLAFSDSSYVYVKAPSGAPVRLPAPAGLTQSPDLSIYKDVTISEGGAVIATGPLGALNVWESPGDDLWSGTPVRFGGVDRFGDVRINDVSAAHEKDLMAFALRLENAEYAVAVCPTPSLDTPVCDVSAPGGALINIGRSRLPPPPTEEGEKDVFADCRVNRFWINSVAISPDGTKIAAGTSDCAAQVVDLSAPNAPPTQLVGHVGSIAGLGFDASADRLVTASSDWWGSIFDIKTGARIELDKEHGSRLTDAVFAPSGDIVATVSLDERVILWDSQTGEPVIKLPGHRSNINVIDAATRPDGTMLLVTGTSDGEVSVYPYFATAQEMQSFAEKTIKSVVGQDALKKSDPTTPE